MPLGKLVAHLMRTQEIARIFFRHGFGDLLQRMGLAQYVIWTSPEDQAGAPIPREAKSAARSFREALEESGGALVKLGQLLSTRPDVLPRPWIEELAHLQDDVSPVGFAEIQEALETELGPLAESFLMVDPQPLAAGSVAQVHRAVTLAGHDVVVKVRRRGAKKRLLEDCDILLVLAELLERHVPEATNYRPVRIVGEFRNAVITELDFTLEGNHLDRFRVDFEQHPSVIFPRPYWDHTTQRVLTMERIEGIKISLTENLRSLGVNTTQIARLLAESILRQILEFGFFHGDPHPGNLLVVEGDGICFLDCGMVGHLDEYMRENLILLVAAGIRKDAEAVADILVDMNALPNDMDRSRFLHEAELFLDRYHSLPLKRIRLSSIVEEITGLINRFDMHIPSDLILVGKALITLEGVGRQLDPDFDAVATAEPLIREMVFTTLGPRFVARKIFQGSRELFRLFRELPPGLRELSRALRENQLRITLEHRGLSDIARRMDVASSRLSAALIIASLVLGSALIIVFGTEPLVLGLPALGLGGLILAGVILLGMILGPLIKPKDFGRRRGGDL